MPFTPPVKSPNIDKLFAYLQKNQWHNLSTSFSGFVRKEFEENINKIQEDDARYRNLKLLVEYSEMGRFSEAKNLIDPAYKEFNDMINRLTELQLSPRGRDNPGHYTSRQDTYRHETYRQDTRRQEPNRQDTYRPDANRQDTYQPDANRQETYRPDANRQDPYRPDANRQETYRPSSDRRESYPEDMNRPVPGTPQRRDIHTPQRQAPSPQMEYRREQPLNDRSPRKDQNSYLPYSDPPQYDPHQANYDALRLKTPDRGSSNDAAPRVGTPADHAQAHTQRVGTPADRAQQPAHVAPDGRTHKLTSASQMQSSKALWGRDHGDSDADKVSNSTYRRTFHGYAVDNHERVDKDKYRENFGSLAERGLYRGGDDQSVTSEDRRSAHGHGQQDGSEIDQRPSELARRFREIYNNEWTDAYDEICKDFGSERTVRQLLWIVTEACHIANDVADRQLAELEKQAFGVMTTPGSNDECWLVAVDIAGKQLRDLEKAALGLMSNPEPGHHVTNAPAQHRGYLPRHLGETLPTSKPLLLKYRKQTAVLSIPFVKEECREKISRRMMDSSHFQKSFVADSSRLTEYIYKCAEIVWMMCVQDPPVVLEYITKDTEGSRFDHDHYTVYTKSGTTYDYGVWPMVRLGKRGQILAKGIAQGI